MARAGAQVVGLDITPRMIELAVQKANPAAGACAFIVGDMLNLPFPDRSFALVMAPYGILQSLVREADLKATLESVSRVLSARGVFGLDLVPDLPVWKEYRNRVRFQGSRKGGESRITLVESVRQDRARRLTIFDQEYIERRGTERRARKFSLVFRTLSVPEMTSRLERAGFRISAILGDYNGKPWDPRADVWLILAQKC